MRRTCPNCGYEEEDTAFEWKNNGIICPHCGYDVLNLEMPSK